MKIMHVLLGSNIGDRKDYLDRAIGALARSVGTIVETSSVYETAPWGNNDQGAFLNQVVRLNTPLDPNSALVEILSIEKSLGRIRQERWGARIIDIDILFYDDCIIQSENLIIPHPELHNRRFTLIPIVEISATLIHPIFKKSMQELLESCTDQLEVYEFSFDKKLD